MINKLKSRKLWVTIASTALLSIAESIGIPEQVASNILSLAMTYIIGQGLVDGAKAISK